MTKRKRLTPEQATEIRLYIKEGKKTSWIIDKYGCSRQTINHIKKNRRFVVKEVNPCSEEELFRSEQERGR